ncbi:MAG: DUF2695 domain-containing protein [Brevibacterium yomogidense]|uniref:DUF2695 domain-containing protein n=1 Tax=Brevibacterium yomogidense TaxID=946573 RepID=A0A1X6X1K7_9MICO|nr:MULTISPECIES: DUF2695 domain-containing protein [Brevibacterium]SLM92443.1 hypothetical protein FM105_03130 [Brevibacterium yomogidense]SMX93707.1 Protein of unknown function (DUF2695) [Brevibacterium sp. Mu109]
MKANTKSAEAERIVRDAALALMTPEMGECLVCFVDRQLRSFGCDNTHRFTLQYRDASAPRATAIVKRLSRLGACCCDCEIFLNAYEPAFALWSRDRWVEDAQGEATCLEGGPPDVMPPCAGVRRGAVNPCGNWERPLRGW